MKKNSELGYVQRWWQIYTQRWYLHDKLWYLHDKYHVDTTLVGRLLGGRGGLDFTHLSTFLFFNSIFSYDIVIL